MTPAAILRAAWALIEDPAHWTQCSWGKDAYGIACSPTAPTCTQRCADGAVVRVCNDYGSRLPVGRLLNRAALALFDKGYMAVNDTLGHDAVRRVYARAIDMAEAGQ